MEKKPDITFKNSAKVVVLKNTLKQDLVKFLKETPGISEMKFNKEILEIVGQHVENNIRNNKKKKIDKVQLIFDILHEVFTFNEHEKNMLKGEIDYFIQNKIIRKKPLTLLYKSLMSAIPALIKNL